VGVIQRLMGGGMKRHNGGEIRGRARGGVVSHSHELFGGDWWMMEEHLRSCTNIHKQFV